MDKTTLKYGYIAGGIAIALQLLYYLFIDQFSGIGKVLSTIVLVANFGIAMYALLNMKKRNEGFLTFREAFTSFMLVRIISITFGVAFTLLLYFVIDTDYRDGIAEKTINVQMEAIQQRGLEGEQLEIALEKLEKFSAANIMVHIWTFLGLVVFNSVIGMLIAAVTKKNRPVFEE